MGKDGGFLTAKAVSKRIKAKGLGRLRWYCQMCEKQCRDENGFKCHTQSASHRRQLSLFAENSSQYITQFSNEFRREFLLVLRQRYGTSFVNANAVYQEHIKDKDHVHMNATKWTTLSGFVKEIGKQGFCRVEERPDGFWVSFLDKEAAERDRKAREMDRIRMEEEERAELKLRKQVELAFQSAKQRPDVEEDVPSLATNSEPLLLHVKTLNPTAGVAQPQNVSIFSQLRPGNEELKASSSKTTDHKGKRRRSRWQPVDKKSVFEEIIQAEEAERSVRPSSPRDPRMTTEEDSNEHSKSDTPWIRENIVVKVTNQNLEKGTFYRKKGTIVAVVDRFGARVRLHDSNVILEVDQDDLETVIPKPSGKVMLLRGDRCGSQAVVQSINTERYTITVLFPETGEIVSDVDYEDVSRVG